MLYKYILVYMSTDTITTQSLQKWGNSTGIRIPKKVIEKARLKTGEELSVSVQGKSIVLTPVKKTKSFTLKDMLKGVTPEDVGGEYDWSAPVGKEIW
jgi:antitoxin MazE